MSAPGASGPFGKLRAGLAGLPSVEGADVDLKTGKATVRADAGLTAEEAIEAVQDKVILSWARGILARIPFLGRRQP